MLKEFVLHIFEKTANLNIFCFSLYFVDFQIKKNNNKKDLLYVYIIHKDTNSKGVIHDRYLIQ